MLRSLAVQDCDRGLWLGAPPEWRTEVGVERLDLACVRWTSILRERLLSGRSPISALWNGAMNEAQQWWSAGEQPQHGRLVPNGDESTREERIDKNDEVLSSTEGSTERELVIRVVAMPADTNPDGDMFGGWVLSQMDLGAWIQARKHTQHRVVTVAIDNIVFP